MTSEVSPIKGLVEIAKGLNDRQDIVTVYKKMSKYDFLQEFAFIFCSNLRDINRKYRLTQTEWTVLMELGHHLQFGNKVKISQKMLAEETGISSANISRAMKRLKEIEIILEIDNSMYLNPQLLAKGKIDNYILEISNNTQIEQAIKSKEGINEVK